MKTLKIAITMLLFTFTTYAQITKGNWMFGGSAAFSYSKTDDKNNNITGTTINYSSVGSYNILIEPNIGYFFTDKIAFGCKLNYINSFLEGSKFDSDGMSLSLGPYLRYYFLKKEKDYNIFIEPAYYRFINRSIGNSNGLGIKSGLVIFMNKSVGIETSFNYSRFSGSKYDSNEIFIGLGFQIHLEKENK
jgi:hypothetical protein